MPPLAAADTTQAERAALGRHAPAGDAGAPSAAPRAAAAPRFRSSLARTRGRAWPIRLLGQVSSLWMAATLLGSLAIVIAVATYYEAAYGRVAAAVVIYHSWWFTLLFGLLALNIFGAAAVRWPWHKQQTGFVITHAGMLVLMAGFAIAGYDRLDGMLVVAEGEAESQLQLPTDYLAVSLDGETVERSVQPIDVAGYPGFVRFCLVPLWPLPPAVAPPARQRGRHLATIGGAEIRLSAAVDHAEPVLGWGHSAHGGPAALRWSLNVTPPGGEPMTQGGWLTTRSPRERIAALGPFRLLLDRTDQPLYAADFLSDPATWPADGRVLIYADGQRYELPPEAGASVNVNGRQLSLRAVHHAAAITDTGELVASDRTDVHNPVVVWETSDGFGGQAWAALPDLIEQDGAVVQVVYQHPAVNLLDGGALGLVEALIDPNGVHLRETSANRGVVARHSQAAPWRGNVLEGAPMAITLSLDAAYAHARRAPTPVAVLADKANDTARFAELSVTLDGETRRQWFARGSRGFITLGDGRQVGVHYANEVYDLVHERDLAIGLERFEHLVDPGGGQSAAYASTVAVQHAGALSSHRISMNEPLHVAGVTAYQSGYSRTPDGRYRSHFTIARDPGRIAKYLGSLLMVVGICTLYAMRRRRRKVV